MTEPKAVQPTAHADALAEPTEKINWVFLVSITLANIGILMVLITPLQNLLQRYAELIAGQDDKFTAVSWITGFGAVAAMVFNPLSGAFSDRTTLRFGRRRPWIVSGTLAAAVLMYIMSLQQSIVGLAIVWFLVLAAANCAFSPLTAYIPDQVPVRQRGLVSGCVGLAQVLGVILGVGIVSVVVPDLRTGTWVLGVLMVIMMLPLLLAVPDTKLPRAALTKFAWGAFWSGFWVSPRKYPDFAWAWITRFLVWVGTALAMIYLLFYLQDYLHYAKPAEGQTVLVGLYGIGTIATAVIGGKLSDRVGKRKIFVIVASVVMGLAVLVLALIPSFGAACFGAFLLGTGYGVYLAVDQALITQVLPKAADRARDLGVINIANTAPQILAPILAAPLVTHLGYPGLFGATALVMVAAGLLVNFIRSVP